MFNSDVLEIPSDVQTRPRQGPAQVPRDATLIFKDFKIAQILRRKNFASVRKLYNAIK